MDYRRRKQIIIVLIMTLILVLAGTGVYYKWFYRAATCFDNKQNQNEEGVDCGGKCALSCEFLTIKRIEVGAARAVFLKDGFYDLAVDVENPNPNFGLTEFHYTFKLTEADGKIITQKEGISFILPNQKKYIIEANVAVPARPFAVEFFIDDPAKNAWQRLINNFELPDIYIHDKQFQINGQLGQSMATDAAQASGIIKNNSNFDFDKIFVSVVLFGEEREIIGINKTIVNTVLAGEDRYFSVQWFSPLSVEVKSMEMSAGANLFSDGNFMKRSGAPEKFQEYQTQIKN